MLKKIGRNTKVQMEKLKGIPLAIYQRDHKTWSERLIIAIREYHLNLREKAKFPSHIYYYSNEYQEKIRAHFYAQTIK